VLAMFVDHAAPDRYLRAVLIGPLSLVATAVAGLAVAAVGRGFRPVAVCATLLAQCLLLAAVSIGRRYRDSPGAPGFWRPAVRPRLSWLAALPAVALTGVLGWQVADAARYRSPESYYTELATSGTGAVVVRSRERAPQSYRLEVRRDGQVKETTEFRLEPDGVRLVPVPAETSGTEVRLYRAGETVPYRHLRL
jgi:hypothetical protein